MSLKDLLERAKSIDAKKLVEQGVAANRAKKDAAGEKALDAFQKAWVAWMKLEKEYSAKMKAVQSHLRNASGLGNADKAVYEVCNVAMKEALQLHDKCEPAIMEYLTCAAAVKSAYKVSGR